MVREAAVALECVALEFINFFQINVRHSLQITEKKQHLENWKENNQFNHHLVINLRISKE